MQENITMRYNFEHTHVYKHLSEK